MKRSSRYIQKSHRERQYYSKAINQLDYEPTFEEDIEFGESDQPKKEDFSIPRSKKPRPSSASEKVRTHLKENWIVWLFSAIGLIILYYGLTFNRDLGKIEGTVTEIKEDVKDLKTSNKTINDKLHSHDLEIQKNTFTIQQIDKNISNRR
jgi:hypothetical protein